MTKSKLFTIFSLAFILGMAGVSFFYPRAIEIYYLYLASTIDLIFLFVLYKNKSAMIAGFIILFFISGMLTASVSLMPMKNLTRIGENYRGQLLITKEPEIKGNYQRITGDINGAKILLNTSSYDEYKYGDLLNINCLLEIPQNKSDSDFDYQMYLAKDGVYYLCQKAEIVKSKDNQGNKVYAFILSVKNKVERKIEGAIPSPQSGLLVGLLLGGDDKLSKNIQNNFSRTGMSHIVAVSGYNVTIIAEYLMLTGIFLGLWRRQAFWFAVSGIFLFILMIGFPSSAVRAGIMGALLLWAMKNGRLANSQNAILASASIMLIINPLLLRWDMGFQLSFLATLGIIKIYPILQENFIDKFDNVIVKSALEILGLTLSAQAFVLPIILYNFKNLSLISPLANLLVLPIIPFTMLLGFIMILVSFIISPLAVIFSWLTYLPLKYETMTIDFLAHLKYSTIEINLAWWGVVVWYIMLSGGVWFFGRKHKGIFNL